LAAEVADVTPVDVSRQDLRAVMGALKMAEGFDVGLEMSGAPAAFDQLFDSVVTGGRIALLGLPSKPTLVDWNKVIFKQLTIKGIYGREMFETWHKMIAMLQSGLDVRKVITHRLSAADFLSGFETMRRGEGGKIVVDRAGVGRAGWGGRTRGGSSHSGVGAQRRRCGGEPRPHGLRRAEPRDRSAVWGAL